MKTVLYGLAGVLIAAGVLVAIASFLSPGQVIHGIDAGLAGTLLAGGGIVLALAWLNESVSALEQTLSRALRLLDTRTALAPDAVAAVGRESREERLSGYGQPMEEVVADAPARADVSDEAEAPAAEPDDTQAVAEGAEGPAALPVEVEEVVVVVEVAETPAEPPSDARPPEAEEAASGEELYVVEEREFRGKSARVLSDGTVEAETDEGWMRFENMEHLEEYMDAMAAMDTGRG